MNLFSAYAIPAVLAVIMFSMGLALRVTDFRRVAVAPKPLAIGIFAQIVQLPILGFLLAWLWPMDPLISAGIMIIAACPGGPMSNLLTHLARGDTALSISLTAVMSLISILTLPLIVNFGLGYFLGKEAVRLPVAETILSLFAITIVPLSIGMVIKARVERIADIWEPRMRRIAFGLFIILVLAAVSTEWQLVRLHFVALSGPVLVLILLVMTAALIAASIGQLDHDQRTAIIIECGIQNGSLAMFVAATLLKSETMMLPGASYGLLMFLPVAVFAWINARAANRQRIARPAQAPLD